MANGNKGGGPTDYNPDKHPKDALEYFDQGKSKKQIARLFKISRTTFYAWMDAHPEFKVAVELGEEWAEGWWLDEGQKGLYSDIKPTMWIVQMRLRFGMADDAINQIAEIINAATPRDKAIAIVNAMAKGQIGVAQANTAQDVIKKALEISDGVQMREEIGLLKQELTKAQEINASLKEKLKAVLNGNA